MTDQSLFTPPRAPLGAFRRTDFRAYPKTVT